MSEIGIVIGESRPERIYFVANRPIRVGDYVMVETTDGPVLYMVEGFKNLSELLSKVTDYQTADEARRASARNPRDKIKAGVARALGLVKHLTEDGKRIFPTLAPEPGASVKPVDNHLLKRIYSSSGREWVEIGYLLRRGEDVRISINVNRVASRHLAILAATGKGKSNLLALLAKRIAEKHGTMMIFDYHGEYVKMRMPGRLRVTAPRINPRLLDAEELADMIGVMRGASVQRAVLAEVYTEEVRGAQDYWGALRQALDAVANAGGNARNRQAAQRLLQIVDRALRVWGEVFDPEARSALDVVENNKINVLDISDLTGYQAQIIVDWYLKEVLEDRKNAVKNLGEAKFKSPVVVAIEEAHVFLPSQRRTRCSETIARIAREGRKFGVSLIIISQRPSRLDADTVSQMGSFAISGLIHPRDQAFVKEVTDDVSDELGASLPSLNPGEMILVGNFIKLPALVKVDLVEEKLIGRDLDAVKLWEDEYKAGSSYSTEELIKP